MAMKVKAAILFLMFGTQVGCQFERLGQEGLGEESLFERYVRLLDVDAVAFMNDEKLLTIEDLPLMSDETFEDALALKRTDIRFFELLCGWYLSKFDLYYRSHLRQTYPVVEDPFRKIDWKSESRRNGSYFVYANFVLLTGRDKTIGPTGHDDSIGTRMKRLNICRTFYSSILKSDACEVVKCASFVNGVAWRC